MGELRSMRRWDPWITATLWAAIAMAVRIWWLTLYPPVPAWDGVIYHRTAERIARGMGFVDTWNNQPPYRPTAFYPVGYPALLGAGYALFGPHRWVAGLLNVLAAGVTTLLTTRLASTAFGKLAGHVAGALWALSPGAVIYTSAFMTEPVSAALLTAAVSSSAHHARTGRASSAIVTGWLLGLGGLVRPPALLVAPFVALVSAPRRHWRTVLRTVLLVGLSCTSVVIPWTIRNCRALDGCALVSVNGGSNLWIGTDPQARGGYRDLRPGEGCDHVHGEVAKDRCYGTLALQRIVQNPLQWLSLAPLKIDQLLSYETSPVSYLRAATAGRALAGWESLLYQVMTAWHRIVLALALITVVSWRVHRWAREITLMVTVVAVLVFVHVIFFGVDRYHFVFAPLLCALAGGVCLRIDGQSR